MLSQSFEVLSWTAVPIGTIAPRIMILKDGCKNRPQTAGKTRPAIIVRACALSQGEVRRESEEGGLFLRRRSDRRDYGMSGKLVPCDDGIPNLAINIRKRVRRVRDQNRVAVIVCCNFLERVEILGH